MEVMLRWQAWCRVLRQHGRECARSDVLRIMCTCTCKNRAGMSKAKEGLYFLAQIKGQTTCEAKLREGEVQEKKRGMARSRKKSKRKLTDTAPSVVSMNQMSSNQTLQAMIVCRFDFIWEYFQSVQPSWFNARKHAAMCIAPSWSTAMQCSLANSFSLHALLPPL